VLEQQERDVAIREVMNGHTNAISHGSVVAFSCRNMLSLRGAVKLGVHVVFNVFEERLELDVRFYRLHYGQQTDAQGHPDVPNQYAERRQAYLGL